MLVLLDNGHGLETPGKRSPDGRVREYAYTRSIVRLIEAALTAQGISVERIAPGDTDIPLKERIATVNQLCRKHGPQNCLLVSVHLNAAGSAGQWLQARGWSCFVSPNASSRSKHLASLLLHEAEALDILGNRYIPDCHYWTANLAMTRDTLCPAVLTENLFQDNRDDVDFLLSDYGRQAIADLHTNAIIRYIQDYEE